MKVAAYYRVSTKCQGEDEKLGLPTQRASVEAFCAKEQHEIVATFEDVGYSGATANRPGLAELLSSGGFDAVVVHRWDRLARDTKLDGYLRYVLEQRKVRMLSATETNGIDPMSVLIQGVLASVAGYERHLISQRLAGARKLKANKGGYAHGQAPFGTKAGDKVLEIEPTEFETLRLMKTLRADGLTIREIATELNALNCKSRNGKRWGPSSVHGALKSSHRADNLLKPIESDER